MAIETILKENRAFPPPEDFKKKAILNDKYVYEQLWLDSQENPEKFWEKAAQNIHWFKRWNKTLTWDPPHAQWFIGGETNASYQCLDQQIKLGKKDKLALIYESENGQVQKFTYRELLENVCRLASSFQNELGLKKGDAVAIYMPLIPEAIMTMLACARIGVTHTVIFAGFSSQAISDRVQDAECQYVFTCDIANRKGQELPLLNTTLQAVENLNIVKKVVVFNRKNTSLSNKCIDFKSLLEKGSPTFTAVPLDAEHPLFILYTSGTTGKPKGIVHSTGGYLVGTILTSKWVFDLKDSDTYWCTADIGWITGHSYVVYGILGNGATAFIYDGALNYPHGSRIWELIDKHKITILYTAPTAIRSFMRSEESNPKPYSLSTLRLLGSVGEPINPEAWMWYHKNVGHEKCPIVDTWWQTETGCMMISPLPGVTETKPGSATRSLPGLVIDIVDEQGQSVPANSGGYLVIKKPWPSMLRNIHKNPERLKEQYFSKFPGIYFTGDGAHKDEHGFFWIKGRVDDVLNVSGHRLGTMEIESAIVSHQSVAEAAVVGKDDELKGQAVIAFVIPKETTEEQNFTEFENILKKHVTTEIGSLARPDKIYFTKSLPKTRSGKIMRRLLKDIANGVTTKSDTTTLENPSLIELLN